MRDLLVLLRGAAGNAVGADHLVALEHRRRAAADAAMRPLVMAARLTSNCGLRSLNHCWITRPSGKRGLIERKAATVKALAMAVSGVMKPASSMRSTAMRWPSGPTTATETGTPIASRLLDHRLDEFAALRRPQLGHSAMPPARPVNLCLTRQGQQLTAKKRVGEYRDAPHPDANHGRANFRTRSSARLAPGRC